MRNSKPNDKAAQIRILAERLQFTLEYMESVQNFNSGAEMRARIAETAENGDLKGLRLWARDVEEMKIALTPAQRKKLDVLLLNRLGINTDDERESLRAEVAEVLQLGRVRSERERQRLEEYIERLEIEGRDSDVIAALRALLRA